MMKPMMFSLTLLGLSLAQSASAAEYSILMEEGAFYPEITYLAPGDIVTFTNNNTSSIEVVAGDASWTSGQLATSASYELIVTPDTALNFAFLSDPEKSGALSFDLAPLSEADSIAFEGTDDFVPETTN